MAHVPLFPLGPSISNIAISAYMGNPDSMNIVIQQPHTIDRCNKQVH